jgi:hypothetical protein
VHSESDSPRNAAPLFTAISLITTFAVSVAIVRSSSVPGAYTGVIVLYFSILIGLAINTIAILIAAIRKEPAPD